MIFKAIQDREKKQQEEQKVQTQNEQGNQQNGWEIRILKDKEEIVDDQDFPKQITINWNANDLKRLNVSLVPNINCWKNGNFQFTVQIGEDYPYKPPKVLSLKKIFHPNIDLDGNVCLNILREDWRPVSSLKDVMFGLLFLFTDPNPTDPLNKEAAQLMNSSPDEFQRVVYKTMKGESHNGVKFDKVL